MNDGWSAWSHHPANHFCDFPETLSPRAACSDADDHWPFTSLCCLQFAEKFQEVKEAAKLARDKSQDKVETLNNHSQVNAVPLSLCPSEILTQSHQHADISNQKPQISQNLNKHMLRGVHPSVHSQSLLRCSCSFYTHSKSLFHQSSLSLKYHLNSRHVFVEAWTSGQTPGWFQTRLFEGRTVNKSTTECGGKFNSCPFSNLTFYSLEMIQPPESVNTALSHHDWEVLLSPDISTMVSQWAVSETNLT